MSAPLAVEIEEARTRLAHLERLAQTATCADLGHDWHSLGGCNAMCGPNCHCSVPVHECRRCGDCDYGQNPEAEHVRHHCAAINGDAL